MVFQARRGHIGILGGSFNPPHLGHLRLAIEVRERLQLEFVDLVPAAVPPHKSHLGLLPFEERVARLQKGIQGLDFLRISDIEARREGPSYTWDTLAAYRERTPHAVLYFILGALDLPTLPAWHKGLLLPERANLVIVPRDAYDLQIVSDFIATYWPSQTTATESPLPDVIAAWQWRASPEATPSQLLYVPVPRIDVSSSLIREKQKAGRSVDFLII